MYQGTNPPRRAAAGAPHHKPEVSRNLRRRGGEGRGRKERGREGVKGAICENCSAAGNHIKRNVGKHINE